MSIRKRPQNGTDVGIIRPGITNKTRISMLRVLLDKVDRMHEHMGDRRIEMKILRKKEKKC